MNAVWKLGVCLALLTAGCTLAAAQAQQQTSPAQTPPVPGTAAAPPDSAAPPPRVPLATQVAPGTNQNGTNQNAANPSLPIEFQSHGLDYEALTHNGVTVMFAQLPPRIKDFNIFQVTVTNGSLLSWTIHPSDFTFVRPDGTTFTGLSADDVVESLLSKASRSDVIKLQLLYENSIYALTNYRPTNGYEQRREAAMAQFVNLRFTAAAAASAIALATVKLKPGDSTDGAVFFEIKSKEKTLGPGQLVAHTCGETFDFQVIAEPKGP